MDYNDLVESIVSNLLEGHQFWSDVNKQLAVGLSLDPNHIGLENTVGKEWSVIHRKGVGKFPTKLGSGESLQQAFADALSRVPKRKPIKGDKLTQGELF